MKLTHFQLCCLQFSLLLLFLWTRGKHWEIGFVKQNLILTLQAFETSRSKSFSFVPSLISSPICFYSRNATSFLCQRYCFTLWVFNNYFLLPCVYSFIIRAEKLQCIFKRSSSSCRFFSSLCLQALWYCCRDSCNWMSETVSKIKML